MANIEKKTPARLDFETELAGAEDGDMATTKAIESPCPSTKVRVENVCSWLRKLPSVNRSANFAFVWPRIKSWF
jgi:hypothetical protein